MRTTVRKWGNSLTLRIPSGLAEDARLQVGVEGDPASGGYVPDRGHVVWLDFDPQTGHEPAKRRPAVVLSPAAYTACGHRRAGAGAGAGAARLTCHGVSPPR